MQSDVTSEPECYFCGKTLDFDEIPIKVCGGCRVPDNTASNVSQADMLQPPSGATAPLARANGTTGEALHVRKLSWPARIFGGLFGSVLLALGITMISAPFWKPEAPSGAWAPGLGMSLLGFYAIYYCFVRGQDPKMQ